MGGGEGGGKERPVGAGGGGGYCNKENKKIYQLKEIFNWLPIVLPESYFIPIQSNKL